MNNTTMMLTPLAVVCVLLYILAGARLLWYRPNGARHRPNVSFIASVAIASLFCRALAVALSTSGPPGLLELVAAGAVCATAYAIRGNLAIFFRSKQRE
ncbi:MAG: phage holin family protein [Achromobacter pestifer]